jgi:hypothetical protein
MKQFEVEFAGYAKFKTIIAADSYAKACELAEEVDVTSLCPVKFEDWEWDLNEV